MLRFSELGDFVELPLTVFRIRHQEGQTIDDQKENVFPAVPWRNRRRVGKDRFANIVREGGSQIFLREEVGGRGRRLRTGSGRRIDFPNQRE